MGAGGQQGAPLPAAASQEHMVLPSVPSNNDPSSDPEVQPPPNTP